MNATDIKISLHTLALSLGTGLFLAGCGSSGSDSNDELLETQSTVPESTGTSSVTTDPGSRNAGFDGTWGAECMENRAFLVPEEDQPGGYVQRTLTIDSSEGSYTELTLLYTDLQCTVEDPNDATLTGSSGDIVFDSLVTTSTGMEATVVRYLSSGSSPDLIGLLYRDGDILYRDVRQSTLLEDVAPVELSLSNRWRLIN